MSLAYFNKAIGVLPALLQFVGRGKAPFCPTVLGGGLVQGLSTALLTKISAT